MDSPSIEPTGYSFTVSWNITAPSTSHKRRSPRARRASFRRRDFPFFSKKSVSFTSPTLLRGNMFGLNLPEPDIAEDISYLFASAAAEVKKSSSSPKRKSVRLMEKKSSPLLMLSKKQVEQDLLLLLKSESEVKHLLRRQQKKRRRRCDNDHLIPGLNLHLITPDSYRV